MVLRTEENAVRENRVRGIVSNPSRCWRPSWRDVQDDGLERMAYGLREAYEGLATFTWRSAPRWYAFYLFVTINGFFLWGE